MAAACATDEAHCGFCKTSIKDRLDSAALPCGHGNCILCLVEKMERVHLDGGITCPQCKVFHANMYTGNQMETSAAVQVESQPTTFGSTNFRLPKSLTLIAEHDTGSLCFSAVHRSNGDVLVGSRDGLQILHRHTNQLVRPDLPLNYVVSAVEHDDKIFVLRLGEEDNFEDDEDSLNSVEMILPSLEHAETMFQFPSQYRPALVLSDRLFGVASGDSHTSFYDILAKKEYSLPVNGPFPYLLPGGYMLSTCDDELTKYKIEGDDVVEIWTCEDIEEVQSVCVDSDGLIYAGRRQGPLQVLSPTGEKLVELFHEKLSDPEQMSIRGDELLVPNCTENKLLIFKINY